MILILPLIGWESGYEFLADHNEGFKFIIHTIVGSLELELEPRSQKLQQDTLSFDYRMNKLKKKNNDNNILPVDLLRQVQGQQYLASELI